MPFRWSRYNYPLSFFMSKDRTQYFPHEANLRSDIRYMKLLKEQGWKGYGIYWGIIELLRITPGYKLPRNFEIFSNFLKVSSFFLKKIVEDYDLFVVTDDFFCSEFLNVAMKEMLIKSAKGRVSANHRWELQRKKGMSGIGEIISGMGIQ